ncbi:MAG: AbrB/MazE/SpoVT family DNA-binding domain-containing protein [Proteobacteria bacterium]|nr:AbrB/MazE/SpoVT family DNA-binding domain-containing protein [Pseudomonadota bacterium]
MNKTYVGTVEDSADGSGDAIITFPPEMIEELGWEEGQELNLDLRVDPAGNVIVITPVV